MTLGDKLNPHIDEVIAGDEDDALDSAATDVDDVLVHRRGD